MTNAKTINAKTVDPREAKLAEYRAEAEAICLAAGKQAIERYIRERVLVDGLPPANTPKRIWVYTGLDEGCRTAMLVTRNHLRQGAACR